MIVGIDLGTTNSLVAVWRNDRAELLPNALGHVLTPSCVSLDEDGKVLVGLAAKDRLLTHPSRSAAAFKRYMGTQHRLSLGGREFRPEELSALVLAQLKRDAETVLGVEVSEAVITVPAYFNNTQRQATRVAGELAGLRVERLLNEPTAAALAYGLHQADAESQFVIFDLGGGTFDVSILELFSGVMEVRATAGDNFLGGEDFVTALVDEFISVSGKASAIDVRKLEIQELARLRNEAERVKRALSGGEQVMFSYRHKDRDFEWEVTAEAFERLSAPLLDRLRTPIERSLRDASINPEDLDRIVMVGGASRMPIVQRMVARLFGRFPNKDIDPDQAIALGAAVQAGLKARDAALSEVVLTDVSPYTLGVEISEELSGGRLRDGVYLPIIERNTVIPASRSHVLNALRDYQPEIQLRVFQGESPNVNDNVPLGVLKVPLPRLPRDQQQVDVRFTYDINGLLEVELTVLANQRKETLVIEQTPGAMTPEEIRRSLSALQKLKIHPRDQAENIATLTRLSRLYEQNIGENRHWVGEQIRMFEDVLQLQEPREIERLRGELNKILDQIEGSPVL